MSEITTAAPEAAIPTPPTAPVFQEPTAVAPESPERAEPKAPASDGGKTPDGVDALPEWAQKEIRAARREAQTARGAKNQAVEDARNDLANQIGKALGLVKDDEPADPAKLTEQLTTTQAAAKQAQVELAVFRAAGDSADPSALLDSKSFLAKVAELDPSDSAAFTAAIAEAVEQNPRLGKTAQAPGMKPNPAQGRSASPPSTATEQIAAAQAAGDHRQVALLKAAQALQNTT